MEEASGFFETPTDAQSPGQGLFELISGNPESWCDIWRADKDGRFRVYKALKRELAGDPVYERLLRKEFEIGYSLRHPNICEYYGFVNIPPLGNCIEMEWVDGRTLDSLPTRGGISKALAAKIVNETCDALAYMHSKQVVHRDLKPSNIMLTHNGDNVKLIDFGLSDSDSHSVLKESAGTQVYASPELVSGGDVDFRTDIFSLGCVIDRLTPAYAKIARKCCHRDPRRRFQGALEVKRAINQKSHAPWVIAAFVLIVMPSVLYLPRPWESPVSEPLRPSHVSDTLPRSGGQDSTGTEPSIPTAPDVPDIKGTKSRQPAPTGNPAEKESASQKSASDQEAIDELFRQATELFGQ